MSAVSRIVGLEEGDEELLVDHHRVPTIGDAGGIVADGTHVYVTDWDGELWVLDATEPSAPRAIGLVTLEMPLPYRGSEAVRTAGLVVRDGYVYVARTAHWAAPGGLHVVDVTTPTAPQQVAAWDSESDASGPSEYVEPNGYPPALADDGVYLTGIPLLAELDIADPRAPRLSRVAELRYPPSWMPSSPKVGDVAVTGETAWVAEPVVGLRLLDLSEPGVIRELAHLQTPGKPSDCALRSDYLLLADGPKGLRVIDTTTLAPVRGIEDRSALRVNLAGTTAFLTGYLADVDYSVWPFAMGLWAVDVADPSEPVVRGEYVLAYGDDDPPSDYALIGDKLFVTAAEAGLDIVRLAEGDPLEVPTVAPTLTPLPTGDLPTPTVAPAVRAFLPAILDQGAFLEVALPTAEPPVTVTVTAPCTATPLPTPSAETSPTATGPWPTPSATPGLVLAAGAVSQPDVAGDTQRAECQHLVVWLDSAAPGAIRGRFVRPDGLGEPFLVSADAGAAGPPAVAYNPTLEKWLVVWAAPDKNRIVGRYARIELPWSRQ